MIRIYERVYPSIFLGLICGLLSQLSWGSTSPRVELDAARLRRLYERFPSLRVSTDLGLHRKAIDSVFATEPTERKALLDLIELVIPKYFPDSSPKTAHSEAFWNARVMALSQVYDHPEIPLKPPGLKELHVQVVGGSIGGMLSALVQAYAGNQVDLFERESSYTRPPNFQFKPSFVDELAAIDPKLAQGFLQLPLLRVTGNGEVERVDEFNRSAFGERSSIPDAKAMGLSSFSGIMQASVVEQFLADFIQSKAKDPRFKINFKRSAKRERTLIERLPEGGFKVAGEPKPDLLVLADGEKSENRGNITKMREQSPSEIHLSARIKIDRALDRAPLWRRLNPLTQFSRVVGAVPTPGDQKELWFVARASPRFLRELGSLQREAERTGLDSDSKEFKKKKEALITRDILMQAALEGFTKPRIAGGTSPAAFVFQQKIAEVATDGVNTILKGDTVGNSHWRNGLGNAIASVSHVEAEKEVLFRMDLAGEDPQEKSKALAAYSDRVLAESKVAVDAGLKSGFSEGEIREWRKSLSSQESRGGSHPSERPGPRPKPKAAAGTGVQESQIQARPEMFKGSFRERLWRILHPIGGKHR